MKLIDLKILFAMALWMAFVLYTGCSSNDDPGPVDCNASNLALTFTATNPTGCGSTDGSITASATGGSAPYQYAIGNQPFGSSPNFTGLGAGTYELKLKDGNGCERSVPVTLTLPGSNLSFTVTLNESGCKTNNGMITVNATGGSTPYTYRLNDGAPSSSSVFSNLAAGTYNVKVTDNANCSFTQSVQVLNGTKFSEVKTIIENKCAVSGCHVSGGGAPMALTTFAAIKENAARIKAVTQSGEMPKGGPKLPQSELDVIACWVDDGALNN
jgi:hypothetical protein